MGQRRYRIRPTFLSSVESLKLLIKSAIERLHERDLVLNKFGEES